MLGYVTVDKGELKVREYEIYTGYYCGICKYIGRTYGQLPRMVLSYDAAFFAILLGSMDPAPDAPQQEHCAVHHIRYKTVIRSRAIEYAGDVMLILAWFKLRDDVSDDGKASARAGLAAFRRVYRKLRARYPGLCDMIGQTLQELSELEHAGSPSLDRTADYFARIMARIMQEGMEVLYGPAATEDSQALHETFAKIGYHLGKWIYLIDAADDIEENIAAKTYNPLLTRFDYQPEKESPQDFRQRIDEPLRFNLFQCLAVLGESLEPLDIQKNSGIIENVIYFGLNRKTEDVLRRIKPEKGRPGRL